MANITFLGKTIKQNGSDLHLVSGNPPRIRVYGELVTVKYRELTQNETMGLRTMLSTSLVGVVSQQLVRRADGRGRIAATEIMINNPAIGNLIREGKTEQLTSAIQSGGLQGMQSLDSALRKLMDAKLISGKEAHLNAIVKQDFERFVGYRAA